MTRKSVIIANLLIIVVDCLVIGVDIAQRQFNGWFWSAVIANIALFAITIFSICQLKEK